MIDFAKATMVQVDRQNGCWTVDVLEPKSLRDEIHELFGFYAIPLPYTSFATPSLVAAEASKSFPKATLEIWTHDAYEPARKVGTWRKGDTCLR